MEGLKEKFEKELKAKLKEELGMKNDLEVPKLSKITINMGLGEDASNGKTLENATKDLETIVGQKPVITRSKKSIAGFKVRKGGANGLKVTLRGRRMYHFLSKLVNIAMPRIRDFSGVPLRGFDGRGNYNYGLKEQLIFPEINYDKVDAIRGMDLCFTTTASTDSDGMALLKILGMPFARNQKLKEKNLR